MVGVRQAGSAVVRQRADIIDVKPSVGQQLVKRQTISARRSNTVGDRIAHRHNANRGRGREGGLGRRGQHIDLQRLDGEIGRVTGKRPIEIIANAIADAHVRDPSRATPPVEGEQHLARVMIVHLHAAVVSWRRTVAPIVGGIFGVRHVGGVERAGIGRPELEIADSKSGSGDNARNARIDVHIRDRLLEERAGIRRGHTDQVDVGGESIHRHPQIVDRRAAVLLQFEVIGNAAEPGNIGPLVQVIDHAGAVTRQVRDVQ